MTKNDLQTGMIVVNKLGEEFMVFKAVKTDKFCGDCLVQISSFEWDELNDFNNDLTADHPIHRMSDIVKVLVIDEPVNIFAPSLHEWCKKKVIWERD